jgi:hypothetical protein
MGLYISLFDGANADAALATAVHLSRAYTIFTEKNWIGGFATPQQCPYN